MAQVALTFDTQTVFANSFDFENGVLSKLKQFRNGPVKIVISEIVVREIERHLIEKIRDARARVEEAHKGGLRYGVTQGAHSSSYEIDPVNVARVRLGGFLKSIDAEIVPFLDVQPKSVFERYFAQQPPFSVSKAKEFPDAFALLSLEAWAQQQSARLITVSGDGDWGAFAKASPHMDSKKELGDAIQACLGDIAVTIKIANALLDKIEDDSTSDLAKLFFAALEGDLATRRYKLDAESDYDILRQETAEVTLESYSFGPPVASRFKTISADPNDVAIVMPIRIRGIVHATFDLEARSLPLGSAEISKAFELDTEAVVSFHGNVAAMEVGAIALDIIEAGAIPIDLGNIDDDINELWEHYD